jgi:hypothetical protein
MTTRAKFRCSVEINKTWGPTPESVTRAYEFTAVYDDGTPENQRFAKRTPSGNLTIQVDNPDVRFEPGQLYYLDISPAE